MKICFATCRDKPQFTADDRALARAFGGLGAEFEPLIWSEPDSVKVAAACRGVVNHTVRPYHLMLNSFCLLLDELEAARARAINKLPRKNDFQVQADFGGIELIEPDLFLRQYPPSAGRLGQHIMNFLKDAR